MHTSRLRTVLVVSLLTLSGAACTTSDAPSAQAPKEAAKDAATPAPAKPAPVTIDRASLALFAPLPAVMEDANNVITPEKTRLGQMLYFDKRLSKNQEISCDTCHVLSDYGIKHDVVATGHKGALGRRNSPTVYNAAGQFAQFWDGRSPSVEHQATQPLVNPIEMASNDKLAVQTLKSMPDYVGLFKAAFPKDKDPVTAANIGKAIGAFERQLVTPSRWDKYLAGDDKALTDAEKAGFLLFNKTGCPACHMGPYLGGSMYQKAGLLNPWPNQKDQGRFEITKKDADKMMFKVPTLRNVTKTDPYFHDGSEKDLRAAVASMANMQLNKTLSDADVTSIVTWLGSLTGDLPQDLINEPVLPKSTAGTPKPNPN